MALNNLFKINFPYGIAKTINDEYFFFNREYYYLGTGFNDNIPFGDKNIKIDFFNPKKEYLVSYKKLTNDKLLKIINDDFHKVSEHGSTQLFFFYHDGNNPSNSRKTTDYTRYFEILKQLSKYEASECKYNTIAPLSFRTKYKAGYLQSEVNLILERYTIIDKEKFNQAIIGITCTTKNEETFFYRNDIRQAILFATGEIKEIGFD